MDSRLETQVGALPDAVRRQALDLAAKVEQADAVAGLGEVTLLSLADGDPAVAHVLAWQDGGLVGYGQRDARSASAELVVDPDHRRHGLGQGLARGLMQGATNLKLWAHGDLPPAQALAKTLGLVPVRQMVLMRATLPASLASERTAPPKGVAWRSFQPGNDESAWLELNAAAFVHHPEQGGITLAGLEQRMRQDWFNPSGFILAVQTEPPGQNRLLGYHWTKVQNGVAEVYGIGVHPDAQGRRLGTALLKRGLEHLSRVGMGQVELYVEADNAPALAAYHRQGFAVSQRHVQYARPGGAPGG